MHESLEVTRREALVAGVAVLGMGTMLAQAADDLEKTPWIDAHSHIWPADGTKYPLAPGVTKQQLDPPRFDDSDLLSIALPLGVGRVVLIQHSLFHLFDNTYLTDAVKKHPQRFRVVGMVDDRKPSPGAEMKRLLKLGVTGFRITPFIHKDMQEQWLDNAGMNEMWKTAAETRQAMCPLINPDHLPGVDAMCQKYPDTPVVIDHFARIGVDGQMRDTDLANLCKLARHKHTNVKISAYYALGRKTPPYLDLLPMIKKLLECFGPQRLMWASDSPYQIQGGNNYGASIALIRDRADFLSAEEKQWLLRKTAERVYFFA